MTQLPPLRSEGGPFRLGVIGDPVAHSLSPALHQPALDQLGIAAVYERWHTLAADLASRVESVRDPEILGASVTVPHKIAVMSMIDEVSPVARRAGAVNTIVNRRGALFGDNTDIYGFGVTVSDVLGERAPQVAIVLGAGGAARAVVLALEATGAAEIIVANRDDERARQLAQDLHPAPVRPMRLDEEFLMRELPRTELLVNATSLGWHPGETPIALPRLDLLPAGAVVADLTYRDTDLLLAAQARGLKTTDGLPMLVHQGVRAFEMWTGSPAPVETMLAAASAARANART
jgi:shikimate dehydrogenase